MAEDVVFTPVRQLAEGLRTRRLSPVALAENGGGFLGTDAAAAVKSGILYSAGINPSADAAWMRAIAALVRALTAPRSNHTGA